MVYLIVSDIPPTRRFPTYCAQGTHVRQEANQGGDAKRIPLRAKKAELAGRTESVTIR